MDPQQKNVTITKFHGGYQKGKNIKKTIDKARKKYPEEALEIDATNTDYLAAHYDYMMQHEETMNKIFRLSN